MKKARKVILLILMMALVFALFTLSAFAAGEEAVEASELTLKGTKAIASAIIIAVGAGAGAFGMALAIRKSVESMARQPEAAGKIQTAMMLGLVFIETAIIYALIVAILVIFVL